MAAHQKKRSHVDTILTDSRCVTAHGGQIIMDALARDFDLWEKLGAMDLHHPPCLDNDVNAFFYALGALSFDLLMAVKVLYLEDHHQACRSHARPFLADGARMYQLNAGRQRVRGGGRGFSHRSLRDWDRWVPCFGGFYGNVGQGQPDGYPTDPSRVIGFAQTERSEVFCCPLRNSARVFKLTA